jgi:hypothetical protein
MATILACFGHLDPRDQNARHDFCELLFMAFAAMLCGAKNCSDIWRFAQERQAMLREVLVLEHGIPSHDTFSALFRKLNPAGFAEAFASLMQRVAAAAGGNRQIALDGKAMRGAFETGRQFAPRMMVSAWGAELRLTLAAMPVAGGNEAKAAIELLKLVDLKGAMVTADALHCSARMAQEITQRGGNYASPRRRATGAGSGAQRASCARPGSAASTALWGSAPSARSAAPALLAASARRTAASTCSRAPCWPRTFSPSCAGIGTSRTACIGGST